jgi:hypothetical protein
VAPEVGTDFEDAEADVDDSGGVENDLLECEPVDGFRLDTFGNFGLCLSRVGDSGR